MCNNSIRLFFRSSRRRRRVVPLRYAAAQLDSFTPGSNFERLFRSPLSSFLSNVWLLSYSMPIPHPSWQCSAAQCSCCDDATQRTVATVEAAAAAAGQASTTLNDANGRLSTVVEACSNTCLHFAFRLKNRLKRKCQHGANIDFVYSERSAVVV